MIAWPALATASPHPAFRTGFTPLFDRSSSTALQPVLSITDAMVAAAPDALDWSTKGAVTPVKDQGHCSSCWAYSTAEAVESATFMQTGKLPSLSEQQLISCDTTDQGCRGGSTSATTRARTTSPSSMPSDAAVDRSETLFFPKA